MEREVAEIIKGRKMAHKRQAQRRNARALLLIVLLFLTLYLFIAAVVLFVNVSIARIDEQFALTLAYTIGVALGLGVYAIILIYAYAGKPRLWPLFDASLPENLQDQATLHSVVPAYCIISIVVLWLAYAKTGGSTEFGTLAGEIDSGSTLVAFSLSALAILEIVRNVFSFFRVHAPQLTYKSRPGLPWRANRFVSVREETIDGVTYIRPEQETAHTSF